MIHELFETIKTGEGIEIDKDPNMEDFEECVWVVEVVDGPASVALASSSESLKDALDRCLRVYNNMARAGGEQ